MTLPEGCRTRADAGWDNSPRILPSTSQAALCQLFQPTKGKIPPSLNWNWSARQGPPRSFQPTRQLLPPARWSGLPEASWKIPNTRTATTTRVRQTRIIFFIFYLQLLIQHICTSISRSKDGLSPGSFISFNQNRQSPFSLDHLLKHISNSTRAGPNYWSCSFSGSAVSLHSRLSWVVRCQPWPRNF